MKIVNAFMSDGPQSAGTKLIDWIIECGVTPRSFPGVSKTVPVAFMELQTYA